MGSHSSDLMKRIRYKLPVCLDFQSFGWDRGDLIQLNEGIPYIFISQGKRIYWILVNISIFFKWRSCSVRGGAYALEISSSTLQAAFLLMFIHRISTKIILYAKSLHMYTLTARLGFPKKRVIPRHHIGSFQKFGALHNYKYKSTLTW